jgi:hypothetical protein
VKQRTLLKKKAICKLKMTTHTHTHTKNQTEILEIVSPFSQTKNTMKGHYSTLEKVEDRISQLKDRIEFKEQEEILVKQLKGICKNSATPSKDQT